MRITNTTHYKHNARNKIILKDTKSYSLTFLPLHKYTQTLKNRITHITTILKQNTLTNITLLAYKQGPDKYSGWFRISATKEQYKIVITEFLWDGRTIKYSYTLLKNTTPILRYDNAPHHPQLPTFPHHKHIQDKIKPLTEPTIEAFIKEAKINAS